MDADLPTDLSAIMSFCSLIKDGADCVFGSRLGKNFVRTEPLIRRILSKGFHSLFVALFGLHYDSQCGVKCARRTVALEIFEHVTVERLAYDVDFIIQADKRRYNIRELDIPWHLTSWSSIRIGKAALTLIVHLLAIWLKNLESSTMEDEAEIARFYDHVKGDVRLHAAKSAFPPRRVWYAKKDGMVVYEVLRQMRVNAPSGHILDVGFGNGNVLVRLQGLGFQQLIRVELSETSVRFLSQRSKSISPIRADARRLPLVSGVFDVIVCSEVFEHLKCPNEALDEFFRVLKKNGLVVLTTPNSSLVWYLVEVVWTRLRRERLEIHYTTISRNRLAYLTRCSGFEFAKISYTNLGMLTFLVARKGV